jgi:D-alanyl-D-alanine carboxypeptidase (penicillin-binding protein 5/6)
MGAPSEGVRDAETVELMDYGFSLYRKRVPVRPGKPLAQVPVRFEGEDLPVSSRVQVRIGVREGDSLEVALDLPDEVEGPLARGDRTGSATVRVNGELIRTVPLFADRDVVAPGLLDRTVGLLWSCLICLGIALVVILGLALLYRRRQERKLRSRLIRAGKRQR